MSQELRYDPKFPTSIWSGDGEVWLASTNCETGGKLEQRAALAERIVRCVNSLAQLGRTNAALLGALKRLATEMAYVHEAADMVRQGADVNLVRSSEGQEALKQARAAIAEAESEKEHGNAKSV